MPWQAWYTLAVAVIVVVVLATERLSAPVTVMGAVAALVAPGVITTARSSTPIGYQTNMIVQGLGGYRWSDFVRVGLIPLALTIMVGLVAIAWAFPLVHQ